MDTSSTTDHLTCVGIQSELSDFWDPIQVHVLEQVTSTNILAKQAIAGDVRNYLFVAESQTSGRGRRGRSFYSPKGAGLYFSLAFPWDREETPVLVTTMAAVAVCRVLERELGVDASIKWVNDLLIDGRKICGILTEAVMDRETSHVGSVVVGIGLNLVQPDDGYPKEIQEIAGAVTDGTIAVNRNQMVAQIINEIGAIIEEFPDRGYLDEYRRRCLILGREVELDSGKRIIPLEITDDGALLYREDGEWVVIDSGEISVVGSSR
ncbi:MAG: biotin--[acetyl-CoA-carboxylase] ligase [Clostridiaceae bacterium]|nr:biotin--[acetyl-CoA-carboxylase] ligase [Clostridiaceae bacterium]